jgi:hypothetical protein
MAGPWLPDHWLPSRWLPDHWLPGDDPPAPGSDAARHPDPDLTVFEEA